MYRVHRFSVQQEREASELRRYERQNAAIMRTIETISEEIKEEQAQNPTPPVLSSSYRDGTRDMLINRARDAGNGSTIPFDRLCLRAIQGGGIIPMNDANQILPGIENRKLSGIITVNEKDAVVIFEPLLRMKNKNKSTLSAQ